ncbi:MAG: FAD binding domain-containing protein, partial [Myxococcota bacterium]|nr:FAD binding domain-containing protein [Myxococcota bacterium]
MIRFPIDLAEALVCPGEIRAGGTDVLVRRKLGIARGDLVDLRDLPGLDRVEDLSAVPEDRGEQASGGVQAGGRMRLGALVRIAGLLADERLSAWPLLLEAARSIPPQIRHQATVGGNLLQRVRCWYFRHPDFPCLKKGGGICFARIGDHHQHSCFDLGPCLAPHPSTLGTALVALDALAEVGGGQALPLVDLLDSGGDQRREHGLEPGQVLTGIVLPEPWVGGRSGWSRTASQPKGAWPSVEVAVQIALDGGRIRAARVVAGAVAIRPLRMTAVEEAISGLAADEALDAAEDAATAGANPPPGAAWKL